MGGARDSRVDRAISYALGGLLTLVVTFSAWEISLLRDELRASRAETAKLSASVAVLEAVVARVEKRLEQDETTREAARK